MWILDDPTDLKTHALPANAPEDNLRDGMVLRTRNVTN